MAARPLNLLCLCADVRGQHVEHERDAAGYVWRMRADATPV
jgi:hypothetical protein